MSRPHEQRICPTTGAMESERVRVAHIPVLEANAGQRVDNFVLGLCRHSVPKSHLYRIIRNGEVRINGKRVKPYTRLKSKDILRLPPLRKRPPSRPWEHLSDDTYLAIRHTILYEDDDLLVVDKPAKLVVHSGSRNNFGLIDIFRSQSQYRHLELAHRIDRQASGCLLCTKGRTATLAAHRLFRCKAVKKDYQALVHGCFSHTQNICLTLKHPNYSQKRKNSTQPCSIFSPLSCWQGCSLIQASPHTGKKHQLRVHASLIGHPILGDSKYGNHTFNREWHVLGFKRMFLHATSISFQWKGKQLSVHSPLPVEFQQALALLRKSAKPLPHEHQ